MAKIVLAYSGGLDTSVILRWLIEQGHEVTACILDVGQNEDLEAAQIKAKKIGAADIIIIDAQKEFVTDFIFPALRGSALYEGRYLLGTSLARPLIAKHLVEVAKKQKASHVSHGATGKGNDQVRFELTCYALAPDIQILAPWKVRSFLDQFKGRSDLLAYAEKHSIPVEATRAKPYSMDANLMHISYEAGVLEDPAAPPPENMFKRTTDPKDAPDQSEQIEIYFESGTPVSVVNKVAGQTISDALTIMTYLNELGGKHGIGRIDLVENRYVGIKSRGVYETPGYTILWKAHQDLELLTVDREVFKLKETLVPKFAELIYYGYWYAPEMEWMRNALEKSQESVTGSVTISLYKGNVTILGRSSPVSLYDPELASMDIEGGYQQEDAQGFIRINAVRLKAYTAWKRKHGKG